MNLVTILAWFSGLSFIYFGFSCLYSRFITSEFERYGLPKYRKLTGFLQLMGAFGLLIGIQLSEVLLIVSATGLSVLMLAGFIVRIRIKDHFIKSSPAFIYFVINLLIALKALI
ncbi:MAG: DoxX family protein [Psychroserpens sp.]|nr:DoxX family protein [Psychroserpens sp.]